MSNTIRHHHRKARSAPRPDRQTTTIAALFSAHARGCVCQPDIKRQHLGGNLWLPSNGAETMTPATSVLGPAIAAVDPNPKLLARPVPGSVFAELFFGSDSDADRPRYPSRCAWRI
jgi:hypothetical protein